MNPFETLVPQNNRVEEDVKEDLGANPFEELILSKKKTGAISMSGLNKDQVVPHFDVNAENVGFKDIPKVTGAALGNLGLAVPKAAEQVIRAPGQLLELNKLTNEQNPNNPFALTGALAKGGYDVLGKPVLDLARTAGNTFLGGIQAGVKKVTGYDLGDKAAEQAYQNLPQNVSNLTTGIAKFGVEQPVEAALAYQGIGNKLGVADPIHSTAAPVINTAKNITTGVVNTALKPVRNAIENYYRKSELESFKKPTLETKPAYSKATDIANNGKGDPAETLVNNKIKSSEIVEKGRYNTNDIAENIRKDAGKLSADTIRPELEKLNYSTPKTPVDEVIKRSIDTIKNNKYIVQETKDTLINNLRKSQVSLQEQYPDGLSLTDLHDEKILRAANAKLSPIGDISTNLEANKNYAISHAAKTLLESKVPKELNIQKFNAELSKQYQAADYLDALHGKPVPRSVIQNIAKTSAKVGGALVGEHVGGGILGGVGGYHVGGMLESMFENMSNPVKSFFLNNLQKTDLPAYNALKNYIGNAEAVRLQTPLLTGATSNSPIPLEGKTYPQDGAQVVPAQKNPVSVNPQTGKFQTTYNSQGQSTNLDQSGSVSQPSSNISNNSITKSIPDKLDSIKQSLQSSGHNFDATIAKGQMPPGLLEKIYVGNEGGFKLPGAFTPEYAKTVISDLANKLNGYQKGLGSKFTKAVSGIKYPTANMLIDHATKILNNSAK